MRKTGQVVPLSQLRRHAGEYVGWCQKHGRHFVISRRGRELAVLVSQIEWRSLRETLDILSDAGLMSQIRRSKTAVQKGHVRPAAEVFGELLGYTGIP
jgi:prevent-host-death family protein